PRARGGRGLARRRPRADARPRRAAAPAPGARRRRRSRLRDRPWRLRDLDPPVLLGQSTHRHGDPREPAHPRDRPRRRLRRAARGGEHGGSAGVGREGTMTERASITRLAVLMAAVFIDMMGLIMVLPLLAIYAKRLGASDWTVGMLVSAHAFGALVTAPFW